GGGEIRTPGPISETLVFKTSAIDHSATPPLYVRTYIAIQLRLGLRCNLLGIVTRKRVVEKRCRNAFLLVATEPKEVHNFQDTKGVQDKKNDEPFLLVIASCIPKCKTFPSQRPDSDCSDQYANNDGANAQTISHCSPNTVSYKECVHMRLRIPHGQ
ncbi:MAG: hypothetical protein JWN90_230, partial [Parcubacteria group bacterium]|nr:hypothetical protein [Parcubacteria group bacterium]